MLCRDAVHPVVFLFSPAVHHGHPHVCRLRTRRRDCLASRAPRHNFERPHTAILKKIKMPFLLHLQTRYRKKATYNRKKKWIQKKLPGQFVATTIKFETGTSKQLFVLTPKPIPFG